MGCHEVEDLFETNVWHTCAALVDVNAGGWIIYSNIRLDNSIHKYLKRRDEK